MPVTAPGTKVATAAPVEPAASDVAAAPPKPVAGGRVEVVADPVAEAVDMVELNEALPKKGD